MKICENCKKVFEDWEETCPECGAELKNVEAVENKKTKTTKILGFSCLGCLGCLGVIFLITILFFISIFKAMTIDTHQYKYNDLKGNEAKKIVTEHIKSAKSSLEDSIKNAIINEQSLQKYETSKEVTENAFVSNYKFRIYESGFTNTALCNEIAFTDTNGNIYCITNWSNKGNKCDVLGERACSYDLNMPNVIQQQIKKLWINPKDILLLKNIV